jgi:hypothetical protein
MDTPDSRPPAEARWQIIGLKVAALSPIEFRNPFIGISDMTTRKVKTEEELAEAIKVGASTIEIEGDLSKKVVKIRGTGPVAWGIVAASLAGGYMFLKMTAVAPAPQAKFGFAAAGAASGAGAMTILGVSASVAAAGIARAYGSPAALKRLRSYKQISYQNDKLVLQA